MNAQVEVVAVSEADIEAVATLFDAYRVWYGTKSDLNGARNFLTQRIRNHQSAIFLARADGKPVGFTQLYPIFSSVSMADVWVLNDLFVAENARQQGIGRLLLETAVEFGRQTGALRLELQTGVNNRAAQTAYEKEGWIKDEEFFYYSLPLE